MNSCLVTQWNPLTITHFCFLEKAIISWLLSNYLLKALARSCIIWKLLWNRIKLEEHIEFMKSTALNLENAKTRVAHVTLIHLSWGHTLGYSLYILSWLCSHALLSRSFSLMVPVSCLSAAWELWMKQCMENPDQLLGLSAPACSVTLNLHSPLGMKEGVRQWSVLCTGSELHDNLASKVLKLNSHHCFIQFAVRGWEI